MPTNRTRRTRRHRGNCTPLAWRYLTDQPIDESALAEDESWELSMLRYDRYQHDIEADTRTLWQRNRAQILKDWTRTRPGTRPTTWWKFDAPEPGRRRVGGTGTPAAEVLAYTPTYACGLPTLWITPFQAAYYNGLAVDHHGQPIGRTRPDGTARRPGDFSGVPPDPADPPTYESQSTYLDRLGLLTDTERQALISADFEPVEHWFRDSI